MPKRIQRKRTKGWRMPENAVYVGRPTKWGNPCKVQKSKSGVFKWEVVGSNGNVMASTSTRERAIDMSVGFYRFFFTRNLKKWGEINELRGKDLACWCPLDSPCHADILLELANKDGE
jgi:hypothetical protein